MGTGKSIELVELPGLEELLGLEGGKKVELLEKLQLKRERE